MFNIGQQDDKPAVNEVIIWSTIFLKDGRALSIGIIQVCMEGMPLIKYTTAGSGAWMWK